MDFSLVCKWGFGMVLKNNAASKISKKSNEQEYTVRKWINNCTEMNVSLTSQFESIANLV